jgi:hypothetical protein
MLPSFVKPYPHPASSRIATRNLRGFDHLINNNKSCIIAFVFFLSSQIQHSRNLQQNVLVIRYSETANRISESVHCVDDARAVDAHFHACYLYLPDAFE